MRVPGLRLMIRTLEVAKVCSILPLHSTLRPPEKHKQSVYSSCRIAGEFVCPLLRYSSTYLLMPSCIMNSKSKTSPLYFISTFCSPFSSGLSAILVFLCNPPPPPITILPFFCCAWISLVIYYMRLPGFCNSQLHLWASLFKYYLYTSAPFILLWLTLLWQCFLSPDVRNWCSHKNKWLERGREKWKSCVWLNHSLPRQWNWWANTVHPSS